MRQENQGTCFRYASACGFKLIAVYQVHLISTPNPPWIWGQSSVIDNILQQCSDFFFNPLWSINYQHIFSKVVSTFFWQKYKLLQVAKERCLDVWHMQIKLHLYTVCMFIYYAKILEASCEIFEEEKKKEIECRHLPLIWMVWIGLVWIGSYV